MLRRTRSDSILVSSFATFCKNSISEPTDDDVSMTARKVAEAFVILYNSNFNLPHDVIFHMFDETSLPKPISDPCLPSFCFHYDHLKRSKQHAIRLLWEAVGFTDGIDVSHIIVSLVIAETAIMTRRVFNERTLRLLVLASLSVSMKLISDEDLWSQHVIDMFNQVFPGVNGRTLANLEWNLMELINWCIPISEQEYIKYVKALFPELSLTSARYVVWG